MPSLVIRTLFFGGVCGTCGRYHIRRPSLSYPAEVIPSPANVLDEWQTGDCFDFAIVLSSLLIGVGYDAYVVYGTAPKQITTKDESDMVCPFSTSFDDLMEHEDHHIDLDEENMIEKPEVREDPM